MPVINQFTTSEPNPPFEVMRRDMYADYCNDCASEGIQPIDWHTWKVLVSELLAKASTAIWPSEGEGEAWACMYAQKVAFDRFHSN